MTATGSIVDLLSRLRGANVELWVDGDRLRFSAPRGALPDELKAELRAHRGDVMEFLRRATEPDGPPPITPVDRAGPVPVSFPQRRMWFFEQVRPGTSTYHLSAAWRLDGALDLTALARCLAVVVARHAVLRTRFAIVDDEPVQLVDDDVALPLVTVDLAGLPGDRRAAEVDRLLGAENERPFDLTTAPLMRARVLRIADDEHVLTFTIHHSVSDMWSAGVLMRELTALYPDADPARLPPLPVRYTDFAAWQRTWFAEDVLRTQLDYWTTQLAGAPPFLELPTDRPHPAAATYAGAERATTLPADLVAGLDGVCRDAGVTRFMLLLAAYYTLLCRYSGQTDILVGTPVANRTRVEVENLVGFFVNTLVLRGDLSGEPSFRELLDRVRDVTLAAYEHQDVPVERLVEVLRPQRDPGRPPLFQTMFVLQNTPMSPLAPDGLTVDALSSRRVATEFDLTMEVVEVEGEVSANVHFNTDVFDADTIERLLANWRTLLAGIVADPDRGIADLPLVSEAERERQLVAWNATDRPYPPLCVHERIAAAAAEQPDATAIVFRDERLGYAELDAAANALAARLVAEGTTRSGPVAVCVERSPDLVVALLGVLKAGAAYLPIDTTAPPERLAYLLDDAGVVTVVTTEAQRARFTDLPVAPLLVRDETPTLTAEQLPTVGMSDLAYVIYTSGSTGRPKGVRVPHRGLANFLAGMDDVVEAEQPGVWLAVTSVSFDIAALELLWPLLHGWQVVLQGEDDVLPGATASAATRTLDFSLFYFSSSGDGAGAPGTNAYRLLLDGARFADRNGFSAVWTPERHFGAFGGLYPNPAVAGAAIAAVTEHVEIRAGSVVLPLHNPIRVAEEWAVVDNLSGGRAGLSVASGWHADDFALAPDPGVFERRKEAMLADIETLRALWRGEAVSVRNGVGRDVEVHSFPRPVRADLPVWLTAAGSPETFRQAGAMGANLLTHLLGQSVDELADKIAVYRRARHEAGHPGDGHVSLMVHTYVGTDAETTMATARGPFREYLRSSFGLVKALAPSLGYDGELAPEDVEVLLDYAFEQYYHGAALMGTVDDCLAMAERLRGIGVDELACLVDFGIDADAVLDGLPLLTRVRESVRVDRPVADFGVAAQIARHGVTHLQGTPSLASILLADPVTRRALGEVDTLVVGGEALPPALATDLVATARSRVINMYGPTETTIWSTSAPVTGDRVTIGRPIANTVIYLLDDTLSPVPVGVPGELCIGGDGVADGYLDRPELTAQRFPDSPFRVGERLYRTGDRARYLPDGRIEFLGRIDRQVKLGGHRIELGEIESVLCEHPAVRQAATVLRAAGDEPAHLVGYLVAVSAPDRPSAAQLREWLLPKVPEVMVPAVVVWLDELPLNASGKVDYRALPDPGAVDVQRSARASVTRREYVAPTDAVEETIAGIWQEVLHVDRVGMSDGFFDLGGHSLMAIQLVSRLRTAFGVDVGLRAVFESATVADLAARVRAADGSTAVALPPLRQVARDTAPPLSFAQQRMWFFDQLNPGITAYHLSATLRLRGGLDAGLLHAAFEEIVGRHEILRTNFDGTDGEPVQVITPHRQAPLPVVDLTALPAVERENVMLRLAHEETRRPFDLAHDPLLRTTLLRLDTDHHVLLLTTHHIVSDSWSIGVLVRELGVLYEGMRAGRAAEVPGLPIQYADFAVWQRGWLDGPVMERQLEYWRAALDGAPRVLALPTDRPRPAVPTFRGSQVEFAVPREVSDGLRALGQRLDVTLFVVLLGAFTTLLHRWAGEEHVVLGVPSAGREAPELAPLIGFFANAMALHVDFGGEFGEAPRFTEVLSRVRDTVIGAYDHQDLPVEKLVADLGVERDLAHNPLFQTMFVYTNDLVMLPEFRDLAVEQLDVDQGHVFMDLNMAMEDGPDGLRGSLDYSADLFDRRTVDWLLDNFLELLAAVVADADARVDQLPMAPALAPAAREPEQEPALPVVVGATFTADPVVEPIAFWAERLAVAFDVVTAPYNQVFQQLLDPASAMAENLDGVNVALLRMADWMGADADPHTVGAEFVEVLAAFQRDRDAPFVAVFCPPAEADLGEDARWRAALAPGLASVPGVVVLDSAALLDQYGVTDHLDPVSEAVGRIPYTPEFFVALGTCLVRQVMALCGDYPDVVVLDATGLDPGPAGHLAGAAATIARQGRAIHVVGAAACPPGVSGLPDGPSLSDRLAALVGRAGVSADRCMLLSWSARQCDQVRAALPDLVVEQYPRNEVELVEFLEHTWLLDPPGEPTPMARWWQEET